jgi:acyl-CoA synthetase (AMP-forming)/AMP-acid ligase II
MNTIVDYLEHWAAALPDKRSFAFLDVQAKETDSYTYRGFLERSGGLATYLSRRGDVKHNDRVLLVYPSGLEIIVAFFACLRIGAIPVLVSPPASWQSATGLAKFWFAAHDCGARVGRATRSPYETYQHAVVNRRPTSLLRGTSTTPTLEWVTTDDVRGETPGSFRNDVNRVLLPQYTSGSTGDPKGVIVSLEMVGGQLRQGRRLD